MSQRMHSWSAEEIFKDPYWEDRFLEAYDEGSGFDEAVIAEIACEAEYIYEGQRTRWHMSMSSIFEIEDRWFKIEWAEGLTDRVESIFDKQPYEVERKEKRVTQTIVEWVAK